MDNRKNNFANDLIGMSKFAQGIFGRIESGEILDDLEIPEDKKAECREQMKKGGFEDIKKQFKDKVEHLNQTIRERNNGKPH